MTSKVTKAKSDELSPSEIVSRTQLGKGAYIPHKVSRITCVVNQQSDDEVAEFLKAIEVDAYIENGRTIREYIKPKAFGIPGTSVKLQSTVVSVFRFTVPTKYSKKIMEYIIDIAGLNIPGRGTIFSQDLVEFSSEAPFLNLEGFNKYPEPVHEVNFLPDLSYVVCVLSSHGVGEQLSKIALQLGICVPILTYGTGSDIRDQLGLIRITISPEKEIVHLVMPKHDSNSLIRLLAEESKLDRPGRGYIYQTPVTLGLIDSRMKIGRQNYAASIDQIIAAIDTLKLGTNWRKRLDAESQKNVSRSFLSKDRCEIAIISEEDRIDEIREACLKVGALGAVTSRLVAVRSDNRAGELTTLIRSEISVPVEIADTVVDTLLGISSIGQKAVDRIQVMDGPSVHPSR